MLNVPAEDETKTEHQVGDVPGRLGAVHSGNDRDSESGGKPEELNHQLSTVRAVRSNVARAGLTSHIVAPRDAMASVQPAFR